MSKSKIMVLTALITFAFAMAAIGNAVAGEKFKLRTVSYTTKWEQLDVPGEEKHIIALCEDKGVGVNMEGKTFGDGSVSVQVGLFDINVKTGLGSMHAYGEVTDRDGAKYYYRSEGKRLRGELWASYWEGETIIVKGTGRYEGIKGKATWSLYPISPMQAYTVEEWEVELP